MNSWALALLAMLASSILKSRAVNAKTPPAVQSTPVCRLQGCGGAMGGGGGGGGGLLADEEETEEDEEEDGSAEEVGRDRDGGAEEVGRDRDGGAEPQEEDEHGGEARDLGPSSRERGFTMDPDWEAVRLVGRLERLGGLEVGRLGVVWVGQSSGRNEGSGVLQLLSTVCESGEDSLVSLEGGIKGGGVWGGEEDGGGILVDEEDEADE